MLLSCVEEPTDVGQPGQLTVDCLSHTLAQASTAGTGLSVTPTYSPYVVQCAKNYIQRAGPQQGAQLMAPAVKLIKAASRVCLHQVNST